MTTDTDTPAPLDYHLAMQILARLIENADNDRDSLTDDVKNIIDNGFVPGVVQNDPLARDVWGLAGWLGFTTDADPFVLFAELKREIEEFDYFND